MDSNNRISRLATPGDKDKILGLMQTLHSNMYSDVDFENFKKTADLVLDDIKMGFFVICEDSEGVPVGFLMFAYEWSDWRNGIFFWLQLAYADH